MRDILQEERFNFMSDTDKEFIIAFDNQLGFKIVKSESKSKIVISAEAQ